MSIECDIGRILQLLHPKVKVLLDEYIGIFQNQHGKLQYSQYFNLALQATAPYPDIPFLTVRLVILQVKIQTNLPSRKHAGGQPNVACQGNPNTQFLRKIERG
ncbi:hypothetical protein CEXT_182291 [Caerostris extrusa]|uniref:Uncharacterized protein n=1 Tax=Caerostris extrusa TaxID=172846 RepID=A0AAV4N264_CAEEX|nr:hypothetical protein CEXT_182291 [Caerostris extrusa]